MVVVTTKSAVVLATLIDAVPLLFTETGSYISPVAVAVKLNAPKLVGLTSTLIVLLEPAGIISSWQVKLLPATQVPLLTVMLPTANALLPVIEPLTATAAWLNPLLVTVKV